MIKFDPKLSIDGVAIIVAAIGAAVWIGRLETTVENLRQSDVVQQQAIKELSTAQAETTRQLTTVATIVNQWEKRRSP